MRKSVVFIVAAAVLGWAVAQAGQELVGTWIANAAGQQHTLVLAADGTGNADGQALRWGVMDGVLGLEQNGQVYYYYYAVEGTQLYVADGVSPTPLVFTRSSGSPAGSLPGGQQTGPLQGTTGGFATQPGAAPQVSSGDAASLVGKWCSGNEFSAVAGGGASNMECFELRADGTYVYEAEGSMSAYAPGAWGGTTSQSADSGRWSYDGFRLTAQSNSGALKSYSLERRNNSKTGDPMLCLDGECYTTYWQKQPW